MSNLWTSDIHRFFDVFISFRLFSAVFYPVSALSSYLHLLAYIFPSTHVFEGMRAVIATGTLSLQALLLSFGLNAIYLVFVLFFFFGMFRKVKERGLLLKLN